MEENGVVIGEVAAAVKKAYFEFNMGRHFVTFLKYIPDVWLLYICIP